MGIDEGEFLKDQSKFLSGAAWRINEAFMKLKENPAELRKLIRAINKQAGKCIEVEGDIFASITVNWLNGHVYMTKSEHLCFSFIFLQLSVVLSETVPTLW